MRLITVLGPLAAAVLAVGTAQGVQPARGSSAGGAPTFYVSATRGNDANGGTSPTDAWQTLARAGSAAMGGGAMLLLARNDTWLDDALTISLTAPGFTIGAYGEAALPRPNIQLARSTSQYTTCLTVANAGAVTVQDLTVGGCALGIALLAPPGATGLTVQRCVLRDIQTPFQAYSPPNPAWGTAILVAAYNAARPALSRAMAFASGAGAGTGRRGEHVHRYSGVSGSEYSDAAEIEAASWVQAAYAASPVTNVTVRNTVAIRIANFYTNTLPITGLLLDSNTVSKCGGNCVGLTQGTNLHLSNSVFLRDTPERLFLYGTTDVILGSLQGNNSVTDTCFNARGEYSGGPDGCSIDFETSSVGFAITGCTFYNSYGAGIMVFGHSDSSHGFTIANNSFIDAGCSQPRDDQGGIGFMCPSGHKPSGTVADNAFTTPSWQPMCQAMFDNPSVKGCSDMVTKTNNRINNGVAFVEQPMPSFQPPPPTSNATSGVIYALGLCRTANATVRYTLDGSRPSELSPVVPPTGVGIAWPGPVVALNMRAWAPGMLPSVTNGVVLENGIMGREARVLPRARQIASNLEHVSVDGHAVAANVSGWAVDFMLPGGGAGPAMVTITINITTLVGTYVANEYRPDVQNATRAPTPFHGFHAALPVSAAKALLGPGKHMVDAWAVQTPAATVPKRLTASPMCVCAGAPCSC